VGHADEVAFRVEFSSTEVADYGQVTLVDRSSTKPVFILYRKPFENYTSTSTDFLYIFSEYATYGAYGDFLAADGQTDKAQVAYQQAESLLLVELDKLERQQGQQSFTTKLYTIHYIRNNNSNIYLIMANEYRGLGLNGGEYINDTAAHTGDFFCIVATEDTVLASVTSNIDNIADLCTGQDATTLSANTAIYGRITSVTLTSGAIIAYKM
jgi:hypothetical protein